MNRPQGKSFPKRAVATLLALLGIGLMLTGCATSGPEERESELPWNTPQPWEGVPFFPGMNE